MNGYFQVPYCSVLLHRQRQIVQTGIAAQVGVPSLKRWQKITNFSRKSRVFLLDLPLVLLATFGLPFWHVSPTQVMSVQNSEPLVETVELASPQDNDGAHAKVQLNDSGLGGGKRKKGNRLVDDVRFKQTIRVIHTENTDCHYFPSHFWLGIDRYFNEFSNASFRCPTN